MNKIYLGGRYRDKFALVDAKDFSYLKKFIWYRSHGYAFRWEGLKRIFMHRDLGLNYKYTDHINNNGLDNRRINLRSCTVSENGANRKINYDNTSGFKGVDWIKLRKRWRARIQVRGKRVELGWYRDPLLAASAYNRAAGNYFGEYAKTNQI